MDRGVTAVEYALVLGVVVLAAVGGIDRLEDSTRDEYNGSVDGIEALPGNAGFGGGGTVATTVPPPSTTTTTTVDGGPTTTVLTHPVTVSAATDSSFELGSGYWAARAWIQVRESVTLDAAPGATVSVRLSAANGSTATEVCTTAMDGRCQVTWWLRKNKHDPVLATVVKVNAPSGWDGQVATASLTRP